MGPLPGSYVGFNTLGAEGKNFQKYPSGFETDEALF
jgi:hypothetical protein